MTSFKDNATYIIVLCIAILALGLWFYDSELYGDIFRFMAIPLGILWLYQKRYIALKYYVCTAVIILGITFICKLSFAYIAAHYGDVSWLQNIIEIAKRPINGEFKGFPSGHTSAAFMTSALVWRFIDRKSGVFVLLLAIFVGYSRIIHLWHTPTQVIAGAILGFIGSFAVFALIDFIDKHRQKHYNRSF